MVRIRASLRRTLARRSFLLVSCVLVITLYSLSVFCTAWFFGSSFVVTLRYAEFGVFWGGDRLSRNSYLYNSGIWPPHPDVSFAGLPFPNVRWLFHGPSIYHLRGPLEYRGPLDTFGFSLPAFRYEDAGASIVLPMGWLLLLPWLLFFLHIRCRSRSSGHCRNCGYCVSAAPSTRCPECGRPVA
jgi:hypothetical protein